MMKPRANELVADQRGAIMMIGLASACLLIGALWFLMGVADMIIWRDRMQEAVDAAAFSSATIHARGMNFVAALNLVILALVTIHVVIGLIADVLTVVAAICLIPPLDPAAPVVYRAALAVRKAQTGYDKVMWVANHTLNAAQTAAAVATPQLGTLAAMEIGGEYDASVIAVGPSNIPMPVPPLGVKTDDGLGGMGGMRLGLPVAFEPYSDMCKRPVTWVVDFVVEKFKKFPVVEWVLGLGKLLLLPVEFIKPGTQKRYDSLVTEFARGVAVILGKGIEALECNSDSSVGEEELFKVLSDTKQPGIDKIKPAFAFLKTILPGAIFPLGADPDSQWGWPGGKKIWGSSSMVKNGSNWMQVWAWTRNEAKVDDHERKVGVARRQYGDIEANKRIQGNYIAQAEFYYDCGSWRAQWGSFACNGNIGESNFTLYSMRWVARLKRVKTVSLTSWLLDSVVGAADGFDAIKKLLIKIPGIGNGEYSNVLYGVLDMEKVLRSVIDDYLLGPLSTWLGYGNYDPEMIH